MTIRDGESRGQKSFHSKYALSTHDKDLPPRVGFDQQTHPIHTRGPVRHPLPRKRLPRKGSESFGSPHGVSLRSTMNQRGTPPQSPGPTPLSPTPAYHQDHHGSFQRNASTSDLGFAMSPLSSSKSYAGVQHWQRARDHDHVNEDARSRHHRQYSGSIPPLPREHKHMIKSRSVPVLRAMPAAPVRQPRLEPRRHSEVSPLPAQHEPLAHDGAQQARPASRPEFDLYSYALQRAHEQIERAAPKLANGTGPYSGSAPLHVEEDAEDEQGEDAGIDMDGGVTPSDGSDVDEVDDGPTLFERLNDEKSFLLDIVQDTPATTRKEAQRGGGGGGGGRSAAQGQPVRRRGRGAAALKIKADLCPVSPRTLAREAMYNRSRPDYARRQWLELRDKDSRGGNLLGRRVDKEKRRTYQRLFRILDDDNSGTLEFAEVQSALAKIGLRMSHDEWIDILMVFDKRCEGKLSFDQFLDALSSSSEWDWIWEMQQKHALKELENKKILEARMAQRERTRKARAAVQAQAIATAAKSGPSPVHKLQTRVQPHNGKSKSKSRSSGGEAMAANSVSHKPETRIKAPAGSKAHILPFQIWLPAFQRRVLLDEQMEQYGGQYGGGALPAQSTTASANAAAAAAPAAPATPAAAVVAAKEKSLGAGRGTKPEKTKPRSLEGYKPGNDDNKRSDMCDEEKKYKDLTVMWSLVQEHVEVKQRKEERDMQKAKRVNQLWSVARKPFYKILNSSIKQTDSTAGVASIVKIASIVKGVNTKFGTVENLKDDPLSETAFFNNGDGVEQDWLLTPEGAQ